ncbi:MAG: hypothetical protein MK212_18510 [Saprospiraceae bacterium]|nr:hypothetical protein [Saprospiraceae bacterium]
MHQARQHIQYRSEFMAIWVRLPIGAQGSRNFYPENTGMFGRLPRRTKNDLF